MAALKKSTTDARSQVSAPGRALTAGAGCVALALYAAVLIHVVPSHEAWADEAQAWQMAKSLSLLQLFTTYLRYELTPGLWHAVLWLLARAHVSYAGMHWAAALFAVLGAGIVLLRSPFPLLLRLALPFTYFLVYQYAVVARSYVLAAPLLFTLAVLWPTRGNHRMTTAVLLGLIANINLHCLTVSLGLAAALAVEWRNDQASSGARENRRAWLAPTAVLAAFAALAMWSFVPPSDAQWVIATKSLWNHVASQSLQQLMAKHGIRWWMLPAAPVAVLAYFLRGIVITLASGFASIAAVGIIAWLLLAWRLKRQETLRYLLPAILLAAFSAATRLTFYHSGLVWLLFLFLCWITWPARIDEPAERCLFGVLALCVAIQLAWGFRAIRYDLHAVYSPDAGGARILQQYLNSGQQVDVATLGRGSQAEYFAVGLEPYFAHEPIHNMRARFWIWKSDAEVRAAYVRDTEARSVVVLMEQTATGDRWPEELQRLAALGYRRVHTACGQVFYPVGEKPVLCHTFYEPRRP